MFGIFSLLREWYGHHRHFQVKKMATLLAIVTVIHVHIFSSCAFTDKSRKPWFRQGRRELRRAIKVSRRLNQNLARNIILFIGDGMGISTITAARIRAGQLRGESGEENLLYFERFPHLGLLKTYSADSQVTGSAAAGTAIMTGIKVNSGVVGCDSSVKKGNCTMYGPKTRLSTILHAFVQEGLSTGVVTNSRITHATPASAYAQIPHRAWEGDVDLPKKKEDPPLTSGDGESGSDNVDDDDVSGVREEKAPCEGVDDIAKQLILDNPDIKVILGGGRRYFLPNTTADPATGHIDPHHRQDGLDLIQEWKRDKIRRRVRHSYVWNRSQLKNLKTDQTEFLLGLFNPSHMDFELESLDQPKNRAEPSLVEMTEAAIRVLKNDKRGFFLMVEGARIDFGHHANSAYTALTETLEFDEAVRVAVELTSSKDTLILVTADHSHAMAVQGYAPRGHDILGLSEPGDDHATLDGLPYTTLGYTNGPVFGRDDLSHVDTASPNFRQAGCIPVSVETHAGEDVTAHALGPMSHLVHATHEQNYLYHVMEYAACVGHSKQYCQNSDAHHRG